MSVPEFAESLNALDNFRQEADYDLDENIAKEEAANLIARVEEIYQSISDWIMQKNSNPPH